jgi:hypothetical protein
LVAVLDDSQEVFAQAFEYSLSYSLMRLGFPIANLPIALVALIAIWSFAMPPGSARACRPTFARHGAQGQMAEGSPITGLPDFGVDLGLSPTNGLILAVLVYSGGKQIQELPVCTNDPVTRGERVGTFDVADFNFDGYPDLMLQVTSKKSNYTYCVWLFDPHAQRFVASQDLSQLTNPRPDSQTRTVTSYENQGCFGTCYDKKTYVWSNGHLKLIREMTLTQDVNVSIDVGGCGYVLTRQERKHGRMLIVGTSHVNNLGVECWQ